MKRAFFIVILSLVVVSSVVAYNPISLWHYVTSGQSRPGYDIGYHAGVSGRAVGPLDMGGYLLTDSTRPLTLGTTATTNKSLTTGDVIVGGKLEVDGYAFLDGGAQFTTGNIIIDGTLYFNQGFGVNKTSHLIGFSATDNPATIRWAVPDTSFRFSILAAANRTQAYNVAANTNPELAIFSSLTTPQHRLSLYHDQTNAVILSGDGAIDLNSASGGVRLGRIIAAAVAQPVACAAGTAGMIVYVDDNDDTNPAELCICAEIADDATFDWVQVQDMTAPCTLI